MISFCIRSAIPSNMVVEVLHVALHDRVVPVGGLVDTRLFESDERGLEEHLRAAEAL